MLKATVEEIRGRLPRRLELARTARVLPGWRRSAERHHWWNDQPPERPHRRRARHLGDGVISVLNEKAKQAGFKEGEDLRDAVRRFLGKEVDKRAHL